RFPKQPRLSGSTSTRRILGCVRCAKRSASCWMPTNPRREGTMADLDTVLGALREEYEPDADAKQRVRRALAAGLAGGAAATTTSATAQGAAAATNNGGAVASNASTSALASSKSATAAIAGKGAILGAGWLKWMAGV